MYIHLYTGIPIYKYIKLLEKCLIHYKCSIHSLYYYSKPIYSYSKPSKIVLLLLSQCLTI